MSIRVVFQNQPVCRIYINLSVQTTNHRRTKTRLSTNFTFVDVIRVPFLRHHAQHVNNTQINANQRGRIIPTVPLQHIQHRPSQIQNATVGVIRHHQQNRQKLLNIRHQFSLRKVRLLTLYLRNRANSSLKTSIRLPQTLVKQRHLPRQQVQPQAMLHRLDRRYRNKAVGCARPHEVPGLPRVGPFDYLSRLDREGVDTRKC